MLLEYYTIRLKDAEPGKGLLHTTQHYDEVRSAIKHFKEKHPDQKVVAFKHEIKKSPMGATFKRKAMFGKDKVAESVSISGGYGSGNHEYDKWRSKGGADAWKKHVTSVHPKAKFTDVNGETHAHVADKKVGRFDHARMSSETLLKECKEDDIVAIANKLKAVIELKLAGELRRAKAHVHGKDAVMGESLQEATRSFKTLMRSIEDKKSIKNLHVPSPSERNPDGSMKAKLPEPKKIAEANTAYHRISVTVSDPNHTMVTKRKDKVQKFIRVKGDESSAIDRAKAHYKKRGLKVHSAEYVEGYDKHIEEATSSDVVHELSHEGNKWTIHKSGLGGGSYHGAYKVRKNGVLQSNHASLGNATAWLASRTDSTESKGNV